MGERKLTMKLMPNVYTVQVCSLKTATVKNGSDGRKKKCKLREKGLRMCACVTGVISDKLFFWPLNVTKNFVW